jgi:hypothetical protein
VPPISADGMWHRLQSVFRVQDFSSLMTHIRVVKPVNINDGKASVLHNLPVVELHPRIGAAVDEFTVPDSFFEPLPDEILKAFSGE